MQFQCSERLDSILGKASDVKLTNDLPTSPISRISESNLAESRFVFSRKIPNCFETRSRFSATCFVTKCWLETVALSSETFLSTSTMSPFVWWSIFDVCSFNVDTFNIIWSKHDFRLTNWTRCDSLSAKTSFLSPKIPSRWFSHNDLTPFDSDSKSDLITLTTIQWNITDL